MSNSDKPDDEIPEDFSTSLDASAIPDDEDEFSSTKIMKDYEEECPKCHRIFPSHSAFLDHLVNGVCLG